MTEFKRYKKIYSLGKEENDGILDGFCYVQEKVDGANASIWWDDVEKIIQRGSRSRKLSGDSFNGFKEYVDGHEGIQKLLKDHPEYRLYGEWLVRHTVHYDAKAYKKFYLFDIHVAGDDRHVTDEEGDRWLPLNEVEEIAKKYHIDFPQIFFAKEGVTAEEIKEVCGKSALGPNGEGVVIKSPTFVNKFGSIVYAKLTTDKFKEESFLTFGGNNKHAENYYEMYVVDKYITAPRVQKVMNKLQPLIDEPLDKKHTPRVAGTVYHDMLTEEIWEIQKKVQKLNFKALSNLAHKRAVKVFHELLLPEEFRSVAITN